MKWHGFPGFKYYASACVALVGLSAASTLLLDRVSMAQQPKITATEKAADSAEVSELEFTEKTLLEAVGETHPSLKIVRKRLEQARARALQAADRAEAASKRVVVQNLGGNPLSLSRVTTDDGEVITEEIRGGDPIVVRTTADGSVFQGIATTGPREVRGFSWLGNPKQNNELQKAIEQFNGKETSDQVKTAAKEKIVSILGEQFDRDMDQRSKQIAELEKKVATLKEQIEKRKGAKSRMIELRFEMMMNESEGLGFPSSWQQPAGVGHLDAAFFPAETRTVRALGMPIPPSTPASPVPTSLHVSPTPPAPPAPPAGGR